MNTNTDNTDRKGPGAPQKAVTFPKNAFTIQDLAKKNPEVCTLTIRKRVNVGLATDTLVKLASKQTKDSKAGRPVFRFMLKTQYDSNLARLDKANAVAKA